MHPGKNNYPVEQQVSNEVAIRSDWLTGEDLFLITEQVNANGTIDFKAIVNPLVNLIWLAGLVFLLGSVVDALAGRPRGAAPRGALRPPRARRPECARPPPSSSARCSPSPRSWFVARPFLREPGEEPLAEPPSRAARARGGARPCARRAEGARVRPPHGEGLGRGLPEPRRRAAARGRRCVASARCGNGEGRCRRPACRLVALGRVGAAPAESPAYAPSRDRPAASCSPPPRPPGRTSSTRSSRSTSRSRRCRTACRRRRRRRPRSRARSTPSRRRSAGSSSRSGDVSRRLAPLEHELELRELKLNRLNALFERPDRAAAVPPCRVPHRARPSQPAARRRLRGGHARRALVPARRAQLLGLRRRARLHPARRPSRQGRSPTRSSPPRNEVAVAPRTHEDLRASVHGAPGQDRRRSRPSGARPPRRAAREQGRARRGARAARRPTSPRSARSERADAEEIDALQAGQRRPRREDPRGAVALHRDPLASSARVHLAGERADHEPVRLAVGPDARGDRPRCGVRQPDRRGRSRHRDLRRLGGRLREPRRDRPRRRSRDRLRAPVADRRLGRPAGRPGRRSSATSARPATRPGRTCTSRCASTARPSTRSATSRAVARTCRSGRFRYRSSMSKP